MRFYYAYVLTSKTKLHWFYVGYSDDLRLRIKRHNEGFVKSTKHYAPLFLIYYEAYLSEKDTRTREKNLKTHQQRDFLKERIKNTLEGLA